LPLLGEAERRHLLLDWNWTATDYPREQTVHGAFAEQVGRAPGAIALSFGGQELSYEDLDRWSDLIALRLAETGVVAETPVGICAERSPDLIAGLLGILKAGGAYVPIDPFSPLERIARLLDEAGPPVVLAQPSLIDVLPAWGPLVLELPGFAEVAAEGPQVARPNLSVCADNLAYVLFTSGSTGRPKGVAVTHRSVLRLVKGAEYAHFGPGEVF